MKWRVLKKEGTKVTLISDAPTVSNKLGLGGAKGYLDGPNIINRVCNTLYSCSKGTARSLNVDDVNAIINPGFDGNNEINWVYFDGDDNEQSLESGIRTIGQIETKTGLTLGYRQTPDGTDISNYTSNFYYYMGSLESTPDNNKEYTLIFKTPNEKYNAAKYWLASRCVNTNFYEGFAYFSMFIIDDDRVYHGYLDYSGSSYYSTEAALCPIVILNSSVQVDTEQEGDGTSTSPWKLK